MGRRSWCPRKWRSRPVGIIGVHFWHFGYTLIPSQMRSILGILLYLHTLTHRCIPIPRFTVVGQHDVANHNHNHNNGIQLYCLYMNRHRHTFLSNRGPYEVYLQSFESPHEVELCLARYFKNSRSKIRQRTWMNKEPSHPQEEGAYFTIF